MICRMDRAIAKPIKLLLMSGYAVGANYVNVPQPNRQDNII